MRTAILSLALLFGASTLVPAYALQTGSVGQDMKDAGHDSKTAVKKGYHKTKHGVKKGYHKTKNGVKEGTNKAAAKTEKGAQKVRDKTDTSR